MKDFGHAGKHSSTELYSSLIFLIMELEGICLPKLLCSFGKHLLKL